MKLFYIVTLVGLTIMIGLVIIVTLNLLLLKWRLEFAKNE